MDILTSILILIITIILIGIIFVLDKQFDFLQEIKRQIQGKELKLPYKKQDFLLNIPERKFFEGLQ